VLGVLDRLHVIPGGAELALALGRWLNRYGYWMLALVSMIENIIVINIYFPGSVAILVAMGAASSDVAKAWITWSAIVMGCLAGQHIDYVLGRRARPVNVAASRLTIRVVLRSVGSYWHPHFAAVHSFAMGSDGFTYQAFLLVVLTIAVGWYIVWGVVSGVVVRTAGSEAWGKWAIVAVLVVWAVWRAMHCESPRMAGKAGGGND